MSACCCVKGMERKTLSAFTTIDRSYSIQANFNLVGRKRNILFSIVMTKNEFAMSSRDCNTKMADMPILR